ncbi:glycogen synthase GlgA [Planctomycetes bacterium K23_9]|uniref:Glycogen synthase n=1 Tax=Stieleria marina TaxID=1930275 RepID=A0A517NNF0_9BACT|nr:Glycogen synthase [Planctomycetes bacterium K23_9]
MNIVYLTSEAVPFAKTGGLADVCGTLPAKIAALGHQAVVIMPAFASIRNCGVPIESTDISFAIPMSDKQLVGARLLKAVLPDSEVPVWLIDQPKYFDRLGLYGSADGDYPDNAQRFAFFCRAAMQAITRMGWTVDIVHCNDWQSGLVPALMNNARKREDGLRQFPWVRHAKSVITVHNLAYQGVFPKEEYRWTGEDWIHFNANQYEYYDQVNYLKTALITADMISTVSPKYAEEICTPHHGCGLDQVLLARKGRVSGIINGIDTDVWSPAKDPHLAENYDRSNWQSGKAANKHALQKHFGLAVDPNLPMIGLVGRLAEQKGWDLILPVLEQHLVEDRPIQWVVLGSGGVHFEEALQTLADRYPDRFGLHVGFSDTLAHRIEAGSDLFVMPSHYEPCGLNQLYSLRYGTIPVVTPTGGLANTVIDCTTENLENQSATGFLLKSPSAAGLDEAIGKALQLRYHDWEKWKQIVETAMSQDWSWRKSACQYVELYERTLALR